MKPKPGRRASVREARPADREPAVSRHAIRPPRIWLYIDAIARYGSIRKAAEALHIASSALNRRVLDLEQELGTSLFDRLARGVRLTAAGELYVGYVRRSLSELVLVASRIEQLRGLVRGRVRVAATESMAGDLLPAAIARFLQTHPGVEFQVTIGAPSSLSALLVDDTVDLVLTHVTPENAEVSVLASRREAFCALVNRAHPLAGRAGVRLRECLGYPIALGDASLAGRALIDRVLAKSSQRPQARLVSNSVELMKAFARMSDAVCFQFRTGGSRDVGSGEMAAIPLTDAPFQSAQLILAARTGRVLPVAAAAFAEEVRVLLAET
jgi:DNA-binding transcriptional LysR family regulator